MSQPNLLDFGIGLALGAIFSYAYFTRETKRREKERSTHITEPKLESNIHLDRRPIWPLQNYHITPVPISTFGSFSYGSSCTNVGRCKVEAAWLIGQPNNPLHKFVGVTPFVCTLGEIDFEGKFHRVGCATFLSSKVLLTAWHVACAINDTSRVCVCIESNFSLLPNGRATCRQCFVRVDVLEARCLSARDIGILTLDDRNFDVVKEIWETRASNFPQLTLNTLSDSVVVLHTDNDTKHTVVNVGEEPTSSIGCQIATQMIFEGTFGTSGAAVFNMDGSVAGVYIGADIFNNFTKGVISINDVILNELTDYGDSILAPFLITSQRDLVPTYYQDWINPNDRKKGYVPEGSAFEKLNLTTTHELCVIQCLGEGGKHSDVQMFSKKFYIESDHFPPFQAYVLSVGATWHGRYYRNGKKRENEFELPTVSLPYKFHRQFITTGSSAIATDFAKKQAKKMVNKKTFKEAVRMNIEEYEKAGLFKPSTFIGMYSLPQYNMNRDKAKALVDTFKAGIKTALRQHQELGFITNAERLSLNAYTESRK